MTNTTIYTDSITNNRYIASAQLTADDMSKDTWAKYTQVVDALAIATWRDLCGKKTKDTIGLTTTALLTFFGVDAKATTAMQKRLMLCCVTVKREKSVPMKNAEKAMRDAKKALAAVQEKRDADPENEDLNTAVDVAEAMVEECAEKVETMQKEPNNIWYQHSPMLDSTRLHASAKCRKLIEDTVADIIAERALMSYEEILAEAEALKAERKARRKAKEAAKKAEEKQTSEEKKEGAAA